MIDFEQAYQQLKQARVEDYINLYDLILLIRSHHPNLSDNKIATVLLDKFKQYQFEYLHLLSLSCYDLHDEEEKRRWQELSLIGEIEHFIMPDKLHEPPISQEFDDLISVLERVEESGITETTLF